MDGVLDVGRLVEDDRLLAPPPTRAMRAGSSRRTDCDTATVLPLCSLVTAMVSDGLPLAREMDVVSTGAIVTSAISRNATGPSVPWT